MNPCQNVCGSDFIIVFLLWSDFVEYTRSLMEGMVIKKNCIKVIFLHRPHQTDTEANEASQRSHLCGSERKTVALHEAASLWTKLGTKSQINAFKVLATAPLGVAQNVTKEMSLKSNLHTKIPEHKAKQSISFISTQRAVHWKKTAGGTKKHLPIQTALSHNINLWCSVVAQRA